MTLLITALLAVPIGVLARCYLEEFAPANRLTQVIEVNINNLAAGALHRLRAPRARPSSSTGWAFPAPRRSRAAWS
jgi:hypothetical protein